MENKENNSKSDTEKEIGGKSDTQGGLEKKTPVKTPEQIKADAVVEEQKRTTKKKAEFIKEFSECLAMIKVACREVGIDRSTYYDWYNTDPDFRKQVERIKLELLDDAEERLLEKMALKETSSIHFFLSRRHPNYRQKQESYEMPTAKTLEDLLDDYADKKIKEEEDANNNAKTNRQNAGQPGTDRKDVKDKGQEGKPSAVHTEPGAELLLGKENEKKPDTESAPKGA